MKTFLSFVVVLGMLILGGCRESADHDKEKARNIMGTGDLPVPKISKKKQEPVANEVPQHGNAQVGSDPNK
jgi:hypothetical protein